MKTHTRLRVFFLILFCLGHTEAGDLFKFELIPVQLSLWLQSINSTTAVRNIMQCSSTCVRTTGCSAFRFDQQAGICQIGSSLKLVKYETDPPVEAVAHVSAFVPGVDTWLMITGGYTYSAGLDQVLLFNWMTREQCSLPPLPYTVSGHAMTSGFGVPLFCGGSVPRMRMDRKTCFTFEASTKGWIETHSMVAATKFFADIMVPSHGWFFYGGDNINLTSTQKMGALGSEWTFGPFLYEVTQRSCALQMDATTTVFFGGDTSPRMILTYSWATLMYTVKKSVLIKDRSKSSCAPIKSQNEKISYAIFGGEQPGMEIWDPIEDTIKLVLDIHPEETAGFGLVSSKLIPIKDSTELLLFGGKTNGIYTSSIWRYNGKSNFWIKIGDLPVASAELAVVPVNGISCH